MKKVIKGTLLLLMSVSFAFAQEEEKKGSFSLSINHDMFFGLYPVAAGMYPLADNLDFTYYGIMWTGISNGGGGFGTWSEFGVGANIKLAEGKLGVNPQVGVLSGSLLSKSARPLFGEGLVPNLTVNLGTDKIEGQLYFGYYMPLGKSNNLAPNTDPNIFTHYWTFAGYKVNNFITVGAHFEQLNHEQGVRDTNNNPKRYNLYTWLGPYVAFSLSNGSVFKMTAGANISSDEDRSKHDGFYKMQYIINF
ncbi:MAG: hypothetical protein NZM38_06885 [Cytophagales bacterium]|nr:hypothetical protein [Cytophagales bacterium]MDW8384482.1 DUF6733 family protein [Flammeovirgaceae bacterium]